MVGTCISTRTGWYGASDYGLKNEFVSRFMGGLAFDVGISKLIAIQPEVIFIQKGMRTANVIFFYDNAGAWQPHVLDGPYKEYYNYLEMPLLLKFKFGKKINFYTLVGPFVSYAFNGESHYDPPYSTYSWVLEGEEEIIFEEYIPKKHREGRYYDPEYYNRMDAGLYIGGGIGGKLGYGSLFLDVRFGMGFINYHKTENFRYLPEGYTPFYTRAINISLAYYLPIIKKDRDK
jgi:hypothetical protein